MTDTNRSDESTQLTESSRSGKNRVEFEPGESVSETLVTAIASLENRRRRELPVLNESIDADALDELFEPRIDGTRRQSDRVLTFDYAGYDVRVHSDGDITFAPEDDRSME